jgi:Osmosensitive K+ channel histidine kinase
MSGNQRQTLYEDIYYNANRLVQLVENLLAVSKLSNGHFPLQMQEELLEDVIHEAIHQLSKNSTRPIQAYIEPEFLLAHMDTRLIGQVLINLLDNAVSYTPVESIVAVYAFERESNVIIEVRDTGKGIPDEQKIELFQTFKKSHMGQGDTKRGLGIGLSLCQTILKLHESELTVRDNIPHGTIFSFYLKRGGVVNES